jgi:hypothetical protein
MTNQTNKRKSFIIHKDSIEILDKLSDEQAGKLFKAIQFYQITGKSPSLDFTLDLVFTPFLNQFIRDDEDYKKTCEARKEAGSKGGKQKVANTSKSKQKVANLADSDSKSKSDSKNKNKNKNDSNLYSDNVEQLANGLKFVLEAKLNKKLNSNSWREEIRKLIDIDLKQRENPAEDVKRAIQAVADYTGEEYFPVIQSGGSLREKFIKIENFLAKRQNNKNITDKQLYQNLMPKYQNE